MDEKKTEVVQVMLDSGMSVTHVNALLDDLASRELKDTRKFVMANPDDLRGDVEQAHIENFASLLLGPYGPNSNGVVVRSVKRVFKQGFDQVFRSKDGWYVTEVKKKYPDPNVPEGEVEFSAYALFNPNGVEIDRADYFAGRVDNIWGEFHTYFKRTGRRFDTGVEIKLGYAHLPFATVFSVDDSVADKTHVPRTRGASSHKFVALSITENAPGSYVVHCAPLWVHENTPDVNVFSAQQTRTFNVSHVNKIHKRGLGNAFITVPDKSFQTPTQALQHHRVRSKENLDYLTTKHSLRIKKDEIVINSLSKLMTIIIGLVPLKNENISKSLDTEALCRHLRALGIYRDIEGISDHYWFNAEERFHVVNVRKLKKWFKTNQHRVFHNLAYCSREEQRTIDRMMDEDSDR